MRRLAIALALCPLPALAAPGAGAVDAAEAPAAREMGTLRLVGASAGVPVMIDGKPAGETPMPGPWTLPAGSHTVELRPAGGQPIVREVQIAAGQEAKVVVGTVRAPTPTPEVDDPDETPPAVEAATAGPPFSLATAGYITAGVGLAAIGAGVALGLAADSAADDAFAVTPPEGTRAEQQALVDDADAMAFWSNVAYGTGGVLLIGGAAMALLASDGLLAGSATLVPTGNGAMVMGAF